MQLLIIITSALRFTFICRVNMTEKRTFSEAEGISLRIANNMLIKPSLSAFQILRNELDTHVYQE